MSDQDLWNTLKNVQKTLKKWDHVKSKLPKSIREDANEGIFTDLVEAADSLQSHISDALSHEIRAGVEEAPPIKEEVLSSLHEAAHKFIMANRLDFAKELLEAEAELKEFDVIESTDIYYDHDLHAAVADLQRYASGEKIAAEVKPSMWNRIVAKIPGMCYLARKDAEFIQDYVKKMEKLMRVYKKAEAAGNTKDASNAMRQMVFMVHPEWDDPSFGAQLGKLLQRKLWKKRFDEAKAYIKAGKALAELREEKKQKESTGLVEACKKNKKKGCASCPDSMDDLDTALDALVAYASGQKIAAEVKPSMWNKIVAKIPGMCYLAKKDEEFIKKEIKKMKSLMQAHKKAEAAGNEKAAKQAMRQMIFMVHPEWQDPKFNEAVAGLLRGKKYWKKQHELAKKYVKSGEALADLRKEGKASGLVAACKEKKNKKGEACSCTETGITIEQVKVMAKLMEIGETEAARDLGTQLVAQLHGEDQVVAETPLETPPDFSEMGEKRAAFEKALREAGSEKEASGVKKLKSMVDDVIYGNHFQHELSRWTDANFDESKAREMQDALSTSVDDILWKFLK